MYVDMIIVKKDECGKYLFWINDDLFNCADLSAENASAKHFLSKMNWWYGGNEWQWDIISCKRVQHLFL